jgi:hydrogenase maturation protein HypF
MSQRAFASGPQRVRARVSGTVQGVGFRPHVFRLATRLELGGRVLNDQHGVLIEVEGAPERIEAFLARLASEAPPMAAVEDLVTEDAPATGEREFTIMPSERSGDPDVAITRDAATCDACLSELFDPGDRRYRYPFTNCIDCGPRFTIVTGVPYDRGLTTMSAFEMCPECRRECEDPSDRRFHAQPNACPACGPRVRLIDAAGEELASAELDSIEEAAAELRDGRILAVKGLGGFHLACRADDEEAVTALRARKHREDKPFALMAPHVGAARELIELAPAEEALLTSPQRPIVIARRHVGAAVAPAVAPSTPDLGVMLPYSPLHHLLIADAGVALVMTSGNVSDEPIAFRDSEARQRLAGIADLFLIHDRPIHMRTDDSVLRALDPDVSSKPLLLRRSRGYVPGHLALPAGAPEPVLGCGAELKNTFCLARRDRAWVSQHIGDLKNYETLASFAEGIEHFQRLFAVDPGVVAHDLHPDYLSTRYALEREGLEHVGVQHHHAHMAACLAEHGETGTAIGVIFDGAGYGPDGSVWGGELLVGGLADFERCGMLVPVRLPGGDAAVREPWRMACAWLAAARAEEHPTIPPPLRDQVRERDWDAVCALRASGMNSPLTSSVGRLFDAVAALCGIRAVVNYEGQAAAELEGIADPGETGTYPLQVVDPDRGPAVLDARETVRAIAGDLHRGTAPPSIAARFHRALAEATADACAREAERAGTDLVVLSGGVFQNRLLLERTVAILSDRRLRVLYPTRLPPNDGGIAYGQVAVVVARAGTYAPA